MLKNLQKNRTHSLLVAVSALMAVISWAIALYYWSRLPNTIPTHFGITGAPDAWANKSIFYVFFTPFIQTLMFVFFVFLYEKPQFSDMPTTLLLMGMKKAHREQAFGLIRIMLVGTSLWIGAMFTYITWMMNASAINENIGLSPWVMLALIGGLLVWLVWYTIKVYRLTKEYLKKSKT